MQTKRKNLQILIMIICVSLFFSTNFSMSQSAIVVEKSIDSDGFQPYKFIAFGDTRPKSDDNTGLEITADLIEDLMLDHEIEFIIHSGDIVDEGGVQAQYDQYYWPEMTTINDSVPIYYAVGNHEYDAGTTNDLELTAYHNNVNNPGNEVFYSFNSPQNDTHFITLNTDYYLTDNNATRQQEQMDWLLNDFASNTIDRIVVMFHIPLWGANPARVLTEYEPLRAIYHDLLVDNGVDVVFNGHDHMFYHTIRNKTHYVVTGGGTAALYAPIPEHPDIAKTWLDDDYAFKDNHVCLVEVTETQMNVDVYTPNGSIVYQFTVDSAAPDVYSPILSSPIDVSFISGTSNNVISWIVTDLNPSNYSIFQDGVEIASFDWTNENPITYNLDHLATGSYNFTLVVRDTFGYSSTDTVDVQVEAAPDTSTTTTTTTTTTGAGTSFPSLLFVILAFSILYFRKRQK